MIVIDLHKQKGKQWNLNCLVTDLFIAKAFQRFLFGQRQCYVQQVFLNSPELFLCSFGMRSKPGAYVPFRMCQVRCRPTMWEGLLGSSEH